MSRKRIIIYGLLILLAAGIFYYLPYLENLYILSKEKIQDLGINPLASIEKTAEKEISAPPPLRAEKEAAQSFLTRQGVINLTNAERKNNGQKPLAENPKLNAAAEKKARDILAKQYFDHVSPDGNGPDHFVSSADYEYITIGENLALGNFADDRDLVAAWMASPGHRENILRSRFREIGAAVVRGDYEGQSTWVAVQEFGTALAACGAPEESLKKTIDSNTQKIDQLTVELKDEREDIREMNPRGSAYSRAVDDYNALAEEHNALVAKTKKLIEEYNSQVGRYNGCVKSF